MYVGLEEPRPVGSLFGKCKKKGWIHKKDKGKNRREETYQAYHSKSFRDTEILSLDCSSMSDGCGTNIMPTMHSSYQQPIHPKQGGGREILVLGLTNTLYMSKLQVLIVVKHKSKPVSLSTSQHRADILYTQTAYSCSSPPIINYKENYPPVMPLPPSVVVVVCVPGSSNGVRERFQDRRQRRARRVSDARQRALRRTYDAYTHPDLRNLGGPSPSIALQGGSTPDLGIQFANTPNMAETNGFTWGDPGSGYIDFATQFGNNLNLDDSSTQDTNMGDIDVLMQVDNYSIIYDQNSIIAGDGNTFSQTLGGEHAHLFDNSLASGYSVMLDKNAATAGSSPHVTDRGNGQEAEKMDLTTSFDNGLRALMEAALQKADSVIAGEGNSRQQSSPQDQYTDTATPLNDESTLEQSTVVDHGVDPNHSETCSSRDGTPRQDMTETEALESSDSDTETGYEETAGESDGNHDGDHDVDVYIGGEENDDFLGWGQIPRPDDTGTSGTSDRDSGTEDGEFEGIDDGDHAFGGEFEEEADGGNESRDDMDHSEDDTVADEDTNDLDEVANILSLIYKHNTKWNGA
ncbi:hypothetical protein GGS20DRAFT_392649 [Poronia punctata]|nr:hypothetical protein GGS20DRAFT_392649 [Poronia punctata]